MSQGIRVTLLDDIKSGQGIIVERAITDTDDDIALLRDEDGSVWALNNTCTHEGAYLAEGWVAGGYVECPLHSSRFCLKSGAVEDPPATEDTVAHRVEVRGGAVYLFPRETP